MSKSLFHKFEECEGATMAELRGIYRPPKAEALIAGNYLHSYFESREAHEAFVHEYRWDVFKSKKATKAQKSNGTEINDDGYALTDQMYAIYKTIDKCIKALENQHQFMHDYRGIKEYPVTGALSGMWWKGKIDLLNVEEGYFIDLKTTAKMHLHVYSEKYGRYVTWPYAYGYALQMAVYKYLLEKEFNKPFQPIIWAVSKEEIPDVTAIEFSQDDLDFEYYWIKHHLPHIQAVMNGEVMPSYCGQCDYCKTYKQITSTINAGNL